MAAFLAEYKVGWQRLWRALHQPGLFRGRGFHDKRPRVKWQLGGQESARRFLGSRVQIGLHSLTESIFFLRCLLSFFLFLSLFADYCDSFISRGCFIVYYYLTTILSRLSTVSRNYWWTFIGRKKGRKRNTKRCCNTLWIHERLKPVTSIDMYIDRGGTCGQSCQRFSTNKTCLEFKSYSIFLVKIPVKIKIRFVLTDRTRDREREGEKKDSQSTILSTVLSLRWSKKYAREIHSYDSGW